MYNARNGNRGFGDIGGHNNATDIGGRIGEDASLHLGREGGMQWEHLRIGAVGLIHGGNGVVEFAYKAVDVVLARHKDEDVAGDWMGAVDLKGCVEGGVDVAGGGLGGVSDVDIECAAGDGDNGRVGEEGTELGAVESGAGDEETEGWGALR